MQASFAGIYLNSFDENVSATVAARFDPREVLQFMGSTPSHDLWHLPLEQPFVNQLPAVEINMLYWPSMASRFSIFYTIFTDSQLATLNPLCFTSDGPTPQTLLFGQR